MGGPSIAPIGTPILSGGSDVLQRLERNTADTVRWLRYLTGAVVVLIVVLVLLLV